MVVVIETKFRSLSSIALPIDKDALAAARRAKQNLWREFVKDVLFSGATFIPTLRPASSR